MCINTLWTLRTFRGDCEPLIYYHSCNYAHKSTMTYTSATRNIRNVRYEVIAKRTAKQLFSFHELIYSRWISGQEKKSLPYMQPRNSTVETMFGSFVYYRNWFQNKTFRAECEKDGVDDPEEKLISIESAFFLSGVKKKIFSLLETTSFYQCFG